MSVYFQKHFMKSSVHIMLIGLIFNSFLGRTLAIVRKQIVFSLFRWFKNLSGKYLILPDKCFKVLKVSIVIYNLITGSFV